MVSRFVDMTLRELLNARGITTIKDFAIRAKLQKAQAWNLWHGRAQVGLHLARKIAENTGIPITDLVTLDPTPSTPPQGKGGRPRRNHPPSPTNPKPLG